MRNETVDVTTHITFGHDDEEINQPSGTAMGHEVENEVNPTSTDEHCPA